MTGVNGDWFSHQEHVLRASIYAFFFNFDTIPPHFSTMIIFCPCNNEFMVAVRKAVKKNTIWKDSIYKVYFKAPPATIHHAQARQ